MSLDVAEWLDGERLEHERKMQELDTPASQQGKLQSLLTNNTEKADAHRH